MLSGHGLNWFGLLVQDAFGRPLSDHVLLLFDGSLRPQKAATAIVNGGSDKGSKAALANVHFRS